MITALNIKDDGASLKLVPSFGPEPAQVLVGRTDAEAMTLLPLMFNLCPSAHRLAAASAMGFACDQAWAMALAEETLVEHLMVMARDWPMAFGLTPNLLALKGLSPLTHERLGQLKDAFFKDEIPQIIKTVQDWPVHWGLYEKSDVDTAFARQLKADKSLAQQVKLHGPVLWLRLWARYREAQRLVAELLAAVSTCAYGRTPLGVGWAEAARGKLYHIVTLKGDRIETYRIISPTERLCAAGGQAQAMLDTIKGAPLALRETAARLILSAVDPCVAVSYGVSQIEEASHA